MFALVDSIQTGDRGPRNQSMLRQMARFGQFAEPWYSSFLEEDFGELFKEAELVPCRKENLFSDKTADIHEGDVVMPFATRKSTYAHSKSMTQGNLEISHVARAIIE